jgi:hypothetical protein
MPSKNDFFHYVGERLRSPEITHFARERALLANTECLTVLAQLRIRHLGSMSVLGPKADLARGATDVSSYLINGHTHKMRNSAVMERRSLRCPFLPLSRLAIAIPIRRKSAISGSSWRTMLKGIE